MEVINRIARYRKGVPNILLVNCYGERDAGIVLDKKSQKNDAPAKHDQHTIAEALTIQGMSPTKLYPKTLHDIVKLKCAI